LACLSVGAAFASFDTAGASERALALYNRTDYTSAIKVLREAPGSADKNAGDLKLLGQCYFMLGQFKNSTDALEKAAVLAPNDSMLQTWLGRAWGRRAETSFPLTAIGYATKTREAFEKAVQIDPGNAEALGDLFDFYMGAPRFMGGGSDKAEGLLAQYEHYDPVGAYQARARVDESKQRLDSAESHLRRAVEAAPKSVSLVLNLAQFLARHGRYEESESVFQQAVNVAPESPRILYAKADTYLKTGRNIEQARELLKKYIAAKNLTPDDPPVWEAQKLLKKAQGG